MKRILCLFLVLTFAILTFGCSVSSSEPSGSSDTRTSSGAAAQETVAPKTAAPETAEDTASTKTYVLRYAGTVGPGSDFNVMVEEPLARLFNEKSNGRITMEIYSGGTLAAQGNAMEAVKSGQADIAYDMPGMYAGVYPMLGLADLPGTYIPDSASGTKIYSEYFNKYCQDEFSELKLISIWSVGSMGVITTKPIKSFEDFKGKQIRGSGSQLDFFTALNATTVSMPVSEVYEGLKLSLIDAAFLAPYAIPVFNFHEVSDYYTIMPMCSGNNVFVMNKDLYESMPADLQKIVDEVSAEITPIAGAYADACTAKTKEWLKEVKPSFEFIELDEAVNQKLIDAALPLMQKKAKELDGKGLPGTEAYNWLQAEANKLLKK